ncbi:MAG: hypothetical protein HDT19_00650 [Oscillibacter sp.]|nr:hypothetical protein [Oscillibacter sp.]
MAKLSLQNGEQILGEAQASHVKKMLGIPQANPGKMYVTNQRVVFEPTQGRASSAFEYSLGDMESFSVGTLSAITLQAKGESHKITGMFNKKLIAALTEAGVRQE